MAASLQSHFSICSSPFDMEECLALIFNSLTQAENRQNTALCQKVALLNQSVFTKAIFCILFS